MPLVAVLLGAYILLFLLLIKLIWKGPFLRRIRVYPPGDAKLWTPDWDLTSIPEDVFEAESNRRWRRSSLERAEKAQQDMEQLLQQYRAGNRRKQSS